MPNEPDPGLSLDAEAPAEQSAGARATPPQTAPADAARSTGAGSGDTVPSTPPPVAQASAAEAPVCPCGQTMKQAGKITPPFAMFKCPACGCKRSKRINALSQLVLVKPGPRPRWQQNPSE